MPLATSSPTTASIPGRCSAIWATEIFSIRSATASSAPPALTRFGSRAQMTDNITELRPKAKDATGAQRQARYRKKRKPVVTAPAISAKPAVALPTPPLPAGRDIAPVTARRNGGTGIAVATMAAAFSLATVSGGFSIYGMSSIFTGALWPVVGMGAALELGKLSAVAWLGHQRGSASWRLKASLTVRVTVRTTLNASGAFGFLSKAHIASALAGDLAVAGRSADTEARLSMQAAFSAGHHSAYSVRDRTGGAADGERTSPG